MLYLKSVTSFRFCPFCGEQIYNPAKGLTPCEHIIAVFISHTAGCDGCLYLSEFARNKYYPNVQFEYNDDAVLKKIIGIKKIRQMVNENNYAVQTLRGKEPGMYEWPTLKILFNEPEDEELL